MLQLVDVFRITNVGLEDYIESEESCPKRTDKLKHLEHRCSVLSVTLTSNNQNDLPVTSLNTAFS